MFKKLTLILTIVALGAGLSGCAAMLAGAIGTGLLAMKAQPTLPHYKVVDIGGCGAGGSDCPDEQKEHEGHNDEEH